jgi:hypothetical protein
MRKNGCGKDFGAKKNIAVPYLMEGYWTGNLGFPGPQHSTILIIIVKKAKKAWFLGQ